MVWEKSLKLAGSRVARNGGGEVAAGLAPSVILNETKGL